MKKLILFIIGLVLLSCKKVEVKPQQPLDPQPIITDTTFVATATGPPNPCTTSCTPIGQTVHCGEPLIFQIMLMHRSLGLAVSCRP